MAVLPERLYPVLPEDAKLLEVDGENLVLTALKKSHVGEDLVARVYDAAGHGCQFGFRLKTPYVGHKPYDIGLVRHGPVQKGIGLVCSRRPLSPLAMRGASETNLLEDPQRAIDLGEVAEGQVSVRPHGILTGRFAFEVLDHSLILKEEAESQTGDKVLDAHK